MSKTISFRFSSQLDRQIGTVAALLDMNRSDFIHVVLNENNPTLM